MVIEELCIAVPKDGDTFAITVNGDLDVANVHSVRAAARLALSSEPCAGINC